MVSGWMGVFRAPGCRTTQVIDPSFYSVCKLLLKCSGPFLPLGGGQGADGVLGVVVGLSSCRRVRNSSRDIPLFVHTSLRGLRLATEANKNNAPGSGLLVSDCQIDKPRKKRHSLATCRGRQQASKITSAGRANTDVYVVAGHTPQSHQRGGGGLDRGQRDGRGANGAQHGLSWRVGKGARAGKGGLLLRRRLSLWSQIRSVVLLSQEMHNHLGLQVGGECTLDRQEVLLATKFLHDAEASDEEDSGCGVVGVVSELARDEEDTNLAQNTVGERGGCWAVRAVTRNGVKLCRGG